MNKKLLVSVSAVALSLAVVVPTFAATVTTTTSIDLACVRNAVEKRENAVLSANDSLYNSTRAALTKRKGALMTAWNITDGKARRAERKTAWDTFKNEKSEATKKYRENIDAAWGQFHKDGKAWKVVVEGVEPRGLDF